MLNAGEIAFVAINKSGNLFINHLSVQIITSCMKLF